MIDDSAVQAYNSRLTVNLGDLATLKPARADAVKAHGSRAEALLKNPDLALFIHQFKFETTDSLAAITGHDTDSNARRVALANQLTSIDQFVATLQRAVYMKNRLVSQQDGPAPAPRDPTKEVYNQ